MNETIPYLPGLSPVAGKELCARFDGGRLSSDGGVLLLRGIEKRLGLPTLRLRTSLPGASQRLAPRAISRLRKPLTGTSLTLRDRPSGLVETAATKGVLPGAPRPRLPPERTPPR